MTAGWIVLSVGVVIAVVMLAALWLRRPHDFDLGTVSQQWIAEQQLAQGHDSQR